MRWPTFKHDGKEYDLAHLHPRVIVYIKPAKGEQPERTFKVNVRYSLHCFTHEEIAGENPAAELLITHEGECRVFDFERWDLSHHFPAIFERLMEEKCFHTGFSNFLTIKKIAQDGSVVKYEIYFVISKASQKGYLNLFVQSAYVRASGDDVKPRQKPIQFAFLLHNTLNKIPIKPPK